jgi:hypothetical protein
MFLAWLSWFVWACRGRWSRLFGSFDRFHNPWRQLGASGASRFGSAGFSFEPIIISACHGGMCRGNPSGKRWRIGGRL